MTGSGLPEERKWRLYKDFILSVPNGMSDWSRPAGWPLMTASASRLTPLRAKHRLAKYMCFANLVSEIRDARDLP
jgi:hypothetical protein